MKNKMLYLIILLSTLLGCESSTMPPSKPSPFTLSAENVSCTDVWLKISLNNVTLPKNIFMRRSDSDSYNVYHIWAKDTLLHFMGLIPGREYSYWYYIGDNYDLPKDDLKNSSNVLVVKTLDTTSYNFTWKIDSIGSTQSLVNGIWGSSSNEVWAVGKFYSKNYWTSYIARYNGNGWSEMYPDLFGDPVRGLQAGNLNGIYGISRDKIWVVGNGHDTNPFTKKDSTWAFAAFWNVNKWEDISPRSFLLPLWAVWAYDEKNVWAVGPLGTILYYNGKTWTQQYSNAGYLLFDIHGTDPANLYAVGSDNSYSSGILLKFDGTGWQKVQTSWYGDRIPFQSVWVESEKSVWVAGIGILINGNGGDDWNEHWVKNGLRKVRGLAVNDIFTCGDNGTIGHFNGKSLNMNRNIFPDQDVFYVCGIMAFKDKVFFAGQGGNGFMNRRGVIYTGTR